MEAFNNLNVLILKSCDLQWEAKYSITLKKSGNIG